MAEARREIEIEARLEASAVAAVAIALQVGLAVVSSAEGWMLWKAPGWIWAALVAPGALLFLALALPESHRRLVDAGRRRHAAIALIATLGLANAAALLALVLSLVTNQVKSGPQLLLEAGTIWGTNVIVFGLWFWELDRGGPVSRRSPGPPPADFQFPQMENRDRPEYLDPDWRPHLLDYVYVSFTNAIAFSPTDAMPLTPRAKLLMMLGSSVSALTILLVAARAVNILK